MKTTAHYLKIFCFLGLPILSYACPALAVGSGNENEAVAGENKALKEKMVRFFLNYLSGDETLYQDNKPVSLADIARQRQLVWDAWVEANNRFDEQKLIGLGKLEQENSGNWDLPAELEPHAVMPYYWGCKGEPGPEGGYPLYLYMHGSGDKGQEWATGILLCQKFDDVPSAYFIPQIPNMGNYYRWWQKSKQFAWEKLLRLAFVSGNINPDKVYFFGISEGGYGSQRLASYYADYLAGAGPMAGGEPLKNAPVENCRNIAFSFLTGAADAGFYRNKLTTYTKNEFERLKKLYPEDYIHRIGRTARANADGVAITFVCEPEQGKFHKIEEFIEKDIYKIPLPPTVGPGPVYNPQAFERRPRGKFKNNRPGRKRPYTRKKNFNKPEN